MLNIIIFLFMISTIILIFITFSLDSRVENLELKEDNNNIWQNIDDIDLTAWEVKELRKFIEEYLIREPNPWTLPNFTQESINRKPAKKHEVNKLKAEIYRIKELIVDTDKLDKEMEKYELEKEIEEKQERLSKME